MTWKNYVHGVTGELQKTEGKNEKIIQRIRQLAYYLPSDELLAVNQIKTADIHINQVYGGLTRPTIKNDLDLLVKHDLLIEENGKYRSNKEALRSFLPGTSAGITKHY
jgi:hypothetical protein